MKTQLKWCGLTIALGGALISTRATAQPAIETKRPATPSLTMAELEKLIGGRTTLTLNLKDATLEEAAAAINQSTGLKVQVRPKPVFTPPPGYKAPPEMHYNFEAKDQPFWEAFLAWQRAAIAAKKVEVPKPDIVLPDGRTFPRRVNPDLGLLQLQKSNDIDYLQAGNPLLQGRTLVNWPYVMVGTRLTRTQQAILDDTDLRPIEEIGAGRNLVTVPLAQPESVATKPVERWQDNLSLDAQVYLDPKIQPLNFRCEVEEAIDEKGNDLRATSRTVSTSTNAFMGRVSFRGSNDIVPLVSIPLRSKPGMGKKLVKLRGAMHFSVVARSQHSEITDLNNVIAGGNIWRDGEEVSIRFFGLKQTPQGWTALFNASSEGQRLIQLWQQAKQEGLGWVETIASSGVFGGPEFQVQIVDDAGHIFTASGSGSGAGVIDTAGSGKPPVSVRPGDSPLPADITGLSYRESAERSFNLLDGINGVKMGRPVKLIVDFPLERREVVVPFEFTDLPLPPS